MVLSPVSVVTSVSGVIIIHPITPTDHVCTCSKYSRSLLFYFVSGSPPLLPHHAAKQELDIPELGQILIGTSITFYGFCNKQYCLVSNIYVRTRFLAPTGAQERLMSVRSFVRSFLTCLKLSIFIFSDFRMTSG